MLLTLYRSTNKHTPKMLSVYLALFSLLVIERASSSLASAISRSFITVVLHRNEDELGYKTHNPHVGVSLDTCTSCSFKLKTHYFKPPHIRLRERNFGNFGSNHFCKLELHMYSSSQCLLPLRKEDYNNLFLVM